MSYRQSEKHFQPCPPCLVPFGTRIREAIRRPGALQRFREQIDLCFDERYERKQLREDWEQRRREHTQRVNCDPRLRADEPADPSWERDSYCYFEHGDACVLETRKEVRISQQKNGEGWFPPDLHSENQPPSPPAWFPLASDDDLIGATEEDDQPLTLAGKFLIAAAVTDAVFKARGFEPIGPLRSPSSTSEKRKGYSPWQRHHLYAGVVREVCRMPDTPDRLESVGLYIQDVLDALHGDHQTAASDQTAAPAKNGDGQASSMDRSPLVIITPLFIPGTPQPTGTPPEAPTAVKGGGRVNGDQSALESTAGQQVTDVQSRLEEIRTYLNQQPGKAKSTISVAAKNILDAIDNNPDRINITGDDSGVKKLLARLEQTFPGTRECFILAQGHVTFVEKRFLWWCEEQRRSNPANPANPVSNPLQDNNSGPVSNRPPHP